MTEETRIVEESTAAEMAAEVEAVEAETTAAPVEEIPVAEKAVDAAQEAVAGVQEETAAIAEDTTEAVAEVVDGAEATVEAVAEAQEEAAAAVESAAAPVVEAVGEAATETATETENAVTRAASNVGQAIADTVETVSESVSTAVENVTEKVAEGIEEAKETVSEAVAAVTGKDETTEATAKQEVSAKKESSDDGSDDEGDKRVVRLSVGQEVKGVIKRITDFGAFVDIGAGRDGLIHISEMAVGRVNQVSDVVQAGQEMTLWIKKLDRARNRISLTLISPDTKTIKDINEGDIVPGTVTRLVPYGAFIDIGVGTDALLHVREMSNNYVAKPEDVVKSGETFDVRIVTVNRRRRRIDLSLKGLRDEPEPEVAEMAEAAAALGVQEDAEIVDAYENVQVLSPMELAFKRAMEAEGVEVDANPSPKRRGRRGKKNRAMQDEIIRRTLETMRE
ncbi:MAG: S1 RNA-binding domain-containing protein [Caldilineaceae bacterium]|nr:S1 RNA-binding domain-containing protein [Caldilineaceae bacterium]